MNRKQLTALSKTKLVNVIIYMQSVLMKREIPSCKYCAHADVYQFEDPCAACVFDGERNNWTPPYEIMESKK